MNGNVVRFNRPIVEVSESKLRQAFAGVLEYDKGGAAIGGFADVTRAIIINELDFPSDSPPRDLRDIWYASVKPVFSKLGFLRKPLSATMADQAFLKARNDKLEKYVRDFVCEGLFTYRQLGVIDHSRSRDTAATYESFEHSSGFSVSFGIYPGIVLATEKDTQYDEIRHIARLYGCSAISGSGQNAFAATEGLFESIKDRTTEIRFLAFTDFDGYGYEISETFADQMRHCIRNAGLPITVETQRLGIELDQLSQEEAEANKYELPDNPVNRKWFEQTGGVGGGFYGIELNALKHARRTEIITEGLNALVDFKAYRRPMAEAYIRRVALGSCHDWIEGILEEIVEQEIDNVDVPEIDGETLKDLALSGKDELPIEASDHRDEAIASNMAERLRR